MPAKREVVSLQPYVVLYNDFVTDTEAEDIKSLAQPGVSTYHMWSNNVRFLGIKKNHRLNIMCFS